MSRFSANPRDSFKLVDEKERGRTQRRVNLPGGNERDARKIFRWQLGVRRRRELIQVRSGGAVGNASGNDWSRASAEGGA